MRRLHLGLAAGLRFEIDLQGHAYFYLGLYEFEIAKHVAAMAYPSCVAFDVGAGEGYYSLVLSKLTGAQVVAFEVDRPSLERLERHRLANMPVGDRVVVHPQFVAASSEPDRNRVALDDLANTPGMPTPDLLKIDVEGAEVDVLKGAERLLHLHRPHVIVETHSAELERRCGDLLLGAGYRPIVVGMRKRLREDRPLVQNRWLIAAGRRPVRR